MSFENEQIKSPQNHTTTYDLDLMSKVPKPVDVTYSMARPRVIVVLDIVDQLSTLYVSHLACIFARSTFLQGLDVHIPLSCQVDGLSSKKVDTIQQHKLSDCRTVGHCRTVGNMKRPCEAVADLHRPCEAVQAV